MIRKLLVSVLSILSVLGSAVAFAQPAYQPSPENLASRQWFQDAKFGMFIHWGVYSVLGSGEWVMEDRPLTVAQYEKLPAQFNPQQFDAAAWVALAKAAGMKYITITARHHDGFSMFDTRQTDYNIVKDTPYGRDPLKQLADECHRQGIKLFFYYSQLDWHNPDYFPRGRTGHHTGRPESGDWNRYLDFMNAQLRELLTNYGPIGGIWFDGMWDKPDADWKLDRTYALIHRVAARGADYPQPSPHADARRGCADVRERPARPEHHRVWRCARQRVAAGNLGDDEQQLGIQHWRFELQIDARAHSLAGAGCREQCQFAAQRGADAEWGNPAGVRQPTARNWDMDGQIWRVYPWHAGWPDRAGVWGVTTQKRNTVYVHVLDWAGPSLSLPSLGRKVKSAKMMDGGAAVEFREDEYGLELKLPEGNGEEVDRVVVVEE